jgi:two-component sensor histidine kinase
VDKCFRKGSVSNLEIDYVDEKGSIIPVEINATVAEQEGKPIVLTIMRDISERRKSEELVRHSLAEKEILLKEIHHRVKNNMQIIVSLLYLQSHATENPEAMSIISDSRDRVRTMGLIHEKLYQSGNLSRVNFDDYLRTLINYLAESHKEPDRKIKFDVAASGLFLSVDSAIPCGLIINELVTNSLKHAFVGRDQGTVSVQLIPCKEGQICLVVSDDGVGLPEDFDVNQTKSMGMNLVQNLADQLGATLTVNRESGLEWVISFAPEE